MQNSEVEGAVIVPGDNAVYAVPSSPLKSHKGMM